MRLAKRSNSFNRLYYKNYKFSYIIGLINCFIRKGYKISAYNIISKFLFKIKNFYKQDIDILLNNVFNKYVPLFSFLTKKIAANVYSLPWLIESNRAKFVLIKWFLNASVMRSEHDIVLRLYNEFNDLYLGYGKTVKKIEDYYALAIKNRPFTRFLRKRRKVFLSRLKKYGIY